MCLQDKHGCRGQCEPHLSAKAWVSRYMNTTGVDPWGLNTTSCFGLPCSFSCADDQDNYVASAVNQEHQIWKYLFNHTNANKTGFALGAEIDPLSRGAWNEIEVQWGSSNISMVFFVDAPGTNATTNQQAASVLAVNARLPLVRLSLGSESIFPPSFESLYTWWKNRKQQHTLFEDVPSSFTK